MVFIRFDSSNFAKGKTKQLLCAMKFRAPQKTGRMLPPDPSVLKHDLRLPHFATLNEVKSLTQNYTT